MALPASTIGRIRNPPCKAQCYGSACLASPSSVPIELSQEHRALRSYDGTKVGRIPMGHILQRLRQDHANVHRLLQMLDMQVAALDRRERPDWEIVEGVIEYLLNYPDLHHHPLEDQILRRMQARDLAAAEPFFGLHAEHREQARALRRMAAATHQILQDASMARQDYIRLLESFVATQREHMRNEEARFFPAAGQVLDAGDWTELGSQVAGIIDPLSGEPVERRFAALREKLEAWDRDDRQAREGAGR